MYKYIFWDLDGTLTQSEFGIIKAVGNALRAFGIEENDRSKLLRFIGPPLHYSFQTFYGFTQEQTDRAITEFRKYYDTECYKDAPLYDGIEDTLKTLKDAGKRLMIVSSKPIAMARKVAAHTGVDKYLTDIIAPEEEMHDPSKAKLINMAIDRIHENDPDAALSEMIMIGDRHYDINGAREVGIDSIGAVYGYGTEEELRECGATYIVNKPAEITKIIENI